MQFNFVIAHIAGSINKAADYLSRLEHNLTEKIELKIRDDIQTIPYEVTLQSTGTTEEEQFYFTQDNTDENIEPEEEVWKRKEQAKQEISSKLSSQESAQITFNITEIHDPLLTNKPAHEISQPNRLHIEQELDPVLLNLKLKIHIQAYNEHILNDDLRHKQHLQNIDRITI